MTTTYKSQHPFVPVIPGDLHQFRLEEAYVISQDVSALQVEARAHGYLSDDPLAGGLSWTGVMEAFVEPPESHAKGRIRVPRVPVGPVVMIVAGLALMAFGFLLNEPVSWAIYEAIR